MTAEAGILLYLAGAVAIVGAVLGGPSILGFVFGYRKHRASV